METQTTTDNFFEEPTQGERWLILNDVNQQMPTRVKVYDAQRIKSATTGKEIKILLLEGEDGNHYRMSAWARDVRACISEFGLNPMAWGFCTFQKNSARTRWEMLPAEKQHTEENITISPPPKKNITISPPPKMSDDNDEEARRIAQSGTI